MIITFDVASIVAYAAKQLPGAGAGLVIGSFIPSVLRKIKAGLTSIVHKAATAVVNEAKTAASDVATKA